MLYPRNGIEHFWPRDALFVRFLYLFPFCVSFTLRSTHSFNILALLSLHCQMSVYNPSCLALGRGGIILLFPPYSCVGPLPQDSRSLQVGYDIQTYSTARS